MFTKVSRFFVFFLFLPVFLADASQFEDVTTKSGLSYIGQSKGAALADFNGDGWPDIWLTNRYNDFQLYVNNHDGTFRDSSDVVTAPTNNAYGAAWGDFDNDGDPDLLNSGPGGCGSECGPVSANTFLINDNGLLKDHAVQYGVDYPKGRGRGPIWFDWNNDGSLDLLLTNSARPDGDAPNALFTQGKDNFLDETEKSGISPHTSNFAQLARFTPGGPSYLILPGQPYPLGVYNYSSLPFEDVKESLGLPVMLGGSLQDTIIADFTGDLLADIFIVRSNDWDSGAKIINNNLLGAHISVDGDQKIIRFKASGNVNFLLHGNLLDPSQLFIGQDAQIKPDTLTFSLSDSDPVASGIHPHNPGTDTGVYIGYLPSEGLWEIQVSASSSIGMELKIEADSQISELETVGFDKSDDGQKIDKLLVQTTDGFTDKTTAAGLDTPTPCGSAVAIDFDNDMDLDIYMVCRGAVTNYPNILYENLGDGTFREVAEAGGAAGSTLGRGDGIAIADFDRDGFMDLMVTNGDNDKPFNEGPHQLFRNLGNENHWLEIDLEGTKSNRDGVGAQVIVTASGVKQVRDQNGGIHLFNQNHQRMHFGLGTNTNVEEITVHWPSGVVQKINNVPADQVIKITESGERSTKPSLLSVMCGVFAHINKTKTGQDEQ